MSDEPTVRYCLSFASPMGEMTTSSIFLSSGNEEVSSVCVTGKAKESTQTLGASVSVFVVNARANFGRVHI
jgi:hypothetical protein